MAQADRSNQFKVVSRRTSLPEFLDFVLLGFGPFGKQRVWIFLWPIYSQSENRVFSISLLGTTDLSPWFPWSPPVK